MTRRQGKRRRFARWLMETLCFPKEPDFRRRILVEPLEQRQLMAGDAFSALLGSAHDSGQEQPLFGQGELLTAEGELVAEGEPAPDLVAFAKALADSGTQFFGAAWCPFCTEQKELFEDGGKYLPFIEVTNPDRSPNQIAIDENIVDYPTWEFPDGSRLTGVQTLQTLSQRSGVAIPESESPSFASLQNTTVAVGSPLHVPIDAYDPNGNPLTITVSSSNPSVVDAEVLQGNRSLRLNVAGFGDMVFELFEGRAPEPSGRVIELTEDGFYDGVTFHRVINNFVIQGGDPTGTGTGGSTLGDFDDQFHLDLQHNRTGVLSFAKSTDDTNDSQFFITEGAQRFLDFNHSVFGQLVEGEANREAISNTATSSSDKPIRTVTIESASIFDDTENGIVVLRGKGNGSATITVTVTDTQGNSTSQAFQATVTQDSANGAPFLNPIGPVETEANTPVNITLTSQDKEGDTVFYDAEALGNQAFGLDVNSTTGVVTVTPPSNFTGDLQFRAKVRQSTGATTSSQDDNQIVTVHVVAGETPSPTSVDLNAASDSGISNTDNITKTNVLTFTIGGTVSGATVQILSGGNVVGSATASGNTTQVTVNNASALGEGSLLFTAVQVLDGKTSAESPSLGVVLDQTAPNELGAGALPITVVVDEPVAVNLESPEEGSGLRYALTNSPAGVTLGATDGVLNWTPTASQLGSQSIALTLTDAAGNTTLQDFSLDVIEDPLVRIRLSVVDVNGQPISTIGVGETFKVLVTVNDLRGFLATGVFGAYMDVTFDSNVIEPVANNPISFVDPYVNGVKGSTATPGLIDELGAFSDSTSELGAGIRTLAEITFTAKAAGNAGLQLNGADEMGNDILLYGENTAIPLDKVILESTAFAIGADFELFDNSFTFVEDASQQSLDVLDNDVISGSSVLTIVDVTSPSGGGSAAVSNSGTSIDYTPAPNFHGEETFIYTVENQFGIQSSATVTVQLTEVNDPPLALNDSFSVVENSSNNQLDLLANDNSGVDDAGAETLSVTSVSSGSQGGNITLGAGGIVSYTPPANFTGTENFTYTLSDGRGGTATGSVAVSVSVDNPPPIAQDDSFNVTEDAGQASFDVLANDSTDDASETLSISGVGSSSNGSAFSVSSDGMHVLYQPAANFSGTEILTYTLQDSGGATATGQVTFTVAAVNDAPDALNDTLLAISSQPTTDLDVLANDVDVDNDTLLITDVSQPADGTGAVAISSDGSRLIFTPPSADFEGTATFTYTVSDPSGESDTATVQVDVRDFVPRQFSGTVHYASTDSANVLSGLNLTLSGTDFTGQSISETAIVQPDGTYAFDTMTPGSYTISREALPFLADTGESIAFESDIAAGDAVNDLLVTGSLLPQYIRIRDFLGSTFQNGLTVAVNQDGTTAWSMAMGAWTELSSLNVSLDNESTLRVTGVDASSTDVAGSVAFNDPASKAYQVGKLDALRLIRIPGTPPDAGILADNAGGEGEADTSVANSSSPQLIGEGEAAPPVTDIPAPTILNVQADSPADNAGNATSDISLATSGGLDASADSGSVGVAAMSAPAVDEAMKDVLPQLELGLSDSLQDSLTADVQSSIDINDQLIANG